MKHRTLLVLIALLAAIVITSIAFFPKPIGFEMDCGTAVSVFTQDATQSAEYQCFKSHLKDCSKARVSLQLLDEIGEVLSKENFIIMGKAAEPNVCRIVFETEQSFVPEWEGKGMECNLTAEEFSQNFEEYDLDVSVINEKCSGYFVDGEE